jgi:hypothetical protein
MPEDVTIREDLQVVQVKSYGVPPRSPFSSLDRMQQRHS